MGCERLSYASYGGRKSIYAMGGCTLIALRVVSRACIHSMGQNFARCAHARQ